MFVSDKQVESVSYTNKFARLAFLRFSFGPAGNNRLPVHWFTKERAQHSMNALRRPCTHTFCQIARVYSYLTGTDAHPISFGMRTSNIRI